MDALKIYLILLFFNVVHSKNEVRQLASIGKKDLDCENYMCKKVNNSLLTNFVNFDEPDTLASDHSDFYYHVVEHLHDHVHHHHTDLQHMHHIHHHEELHEHNEDEFFKEMHFQKQNHKNADKNKHRQKSNHKQYHKSRAGHSFKHKHKSYLNEKELEENLHSSKLFKNLHKKIHHHFHIESNGHDYNREKKQILRRKAEDKLFELNDQYLSQNDIEMYFKKKIK